MPADRSGESVELKSRSGGGQVLLAVGLALTLGISAGVLVLADDLRWLRLGIVAALWAALVGAFVAARYRGQVAERDDRAADLQAVYELELEREIAARREYELQVEQEIRTEVEEQSRQDIVALRAELRTLRETLENLLGGEVLVERYALRAESTRMRPLADRPAAPLKRLTAGSSGAQPEPVTEIMQPVQGVRPPAPRTGSRPAAVQRAEPRQAATSGTNPRLAVQPTTGPGTDSRLAPVQRAETRPAAVPAESRSATGAPRQDTRSVPPLPRRADRAERPPWPSREPAQPETRAVQRPQPPRPPAEPARPPSTPRMAPVNPAQPPSMPRMSPVDPARPPSMSRMAPVNPAQPPPSMQRMSPVEPTRPPTMPRMDPARPPAPPRTAWDELPVTPHPAEVSDRWFVQETFGSTPPNSSVSERLDEDWTPSWERNGRHHSGPIERPAEPPPVATGRRRRQEPDPVPELLPEPEPSRRHARQEDAGGGRRRRAEETPSWQELAAWDPVVKATRRAPSNGSHARDEAEQPQRSGSHASGQSVADLLAAHGNDGPRRRRRRAD